MVGFPLLLVPLAIYNIIVFLMPDLSFTGVLFKVPMMAGTQWPATLGDVLVALGIVLLLFEIIRGARPGARSLMDHFLSLIVFGAAAAEFVMWPTKFGNSTFFLLTLLAMTDFFGGVAQRTRRRAVVATEALPVSPKATRQVEEPAIPPRSEPAPQAGPVAAPTASAQSVAESTAKDPAIPVVETSSPQLQPGATNLTSPGTPPH